MLRTTAALRAALPKLTPKNVARKAGQRSFIAVTVPASRKNR